MISRLNKCNFLRNQKVYDIYEYIYHLFTNTKPTF